MTSKYYYITDEVEQMEKEITEIENKIKRGEFDD
jgi:hypothetical protein|tara:strand:+ start:182 stop:283 length:102 start_codon:yes stop_codon:yes gene_type:complete